MAADLRTKLMQKRSLRAAMQANKEERSGNPLALLKEIAAVARATTRLTTLRIPVAVGTSLVSDSAFDGALNPVRALEVVGNALLDYINELGPIYGKAGQILLSRLTPERQNLAASLQLDRLYGQWPAMSLECVMEIMDREVPMWRSCLKRLDPVPLGVASISQAHAAVDRDGKHWVVKVIKPDAYKRLTATVDAMEQVLAFVEPLTVTKAAKKAASEARELCAAYRGELSLCRELDTIQRVRSAMNDGRKQQLLRVPSVFEECSSDRVLVVERFTGVLLADVVSGRVAIDPGRRALLAKKVLQDLLVQVFELGLFHADPHAGNLILVDDGTVGLFDWGMSGELLPSDRRHIAAVLRSLISMDFDGLVEALAGIAVDAGREVDRKEIARELRGFMRTMKAKPGAKSTAEKGQSLHKQMDGCLRAADRLGIPVPAGLLMMAKTLVTIEGLARGIDPDIKMAYAATPVLLRVARPGIADLFRLASRLPSLLKQFAKVVVVGAGLSGLIHAGTPARALAGLATKAGQGDPAVTAILGDSMSAGDGAHPLISYDPQGIWAGMSGKVSVVARAMDIPAAAGWNITEEKPGAPVTLAAGIAEYRGPLAHVFSTLIHAGTSTFLATPQYTWSYLMARKSGATPENILLAAENGATMEDAPAQAWRVINHLNAVSAGASANLVRVLILFGGNDICASTFEGMTTPARFKDSALATMRIFMQSQISRATGHLEVVILQPLPMVQLIASDLVLDKKVKAYGEETSCRDLQAQRFFPKKPLDLGASAEARQVAMVSQFLPPNPALMCATLFGQASGAGGGDRGTKAATIGNRLRALREALADAVADASKEASRAGLSGKISFRLIESSASVQLAADDVAGDCFHLSAKGQEMLARTITKEMVK